MMFMYYVYMSIVLLGGDWRGFDSGQFVTLNLAERRLCILHNTVQPTHIFYQKRSALM